MSRVEVVSVELNNAAVPLSQWGDALSAYVGRVPPSMRDQEAISCRATGAQSFSGRIEVGWLGDMVLAKVSGTPNCFSRSLRTATPTLPVPLLLVMQVRGRIRLHHQDHSFALNPLDWCLLDTLHAFESWWLGARNEYLVLGLQRPSDLDASILLQQGAARQWNSKTGMARVLQSTLTEAFNELNHLAQFSGRRLQTTISDMAWDALREQLQAPPPCSYGDMQRARLKACIDSQLADPDLSVESIARACGISVRSVHRAFAADPAGTVSKYIWMRRLSHCAAELRDPGQARRPITDICFSWGFNSTSHFSRLFKDQFGVSPRIYRPVGREMCN